MADYFGTGVQGTTNTVALAQPAQSVDKEAGYSHSRVRETYSVIDVTATSSDRIVFGLFKSSDRLIELRVSSDGGSTAGAIDVGLHSVSFANGTMELTAVDADLFEDAFTISSAVAYPGTDIFAARSTPFVDPITERGITFWEFAAAGAASYTEDPGLTFAVTATPSTDFTVANSEIGCLVKYVAGD